MHVHRGWHEWARIIQRQNEAAKTKSITIRRVNLIELPVLPSIALIRVNRCNPRFISSELLPLSFQRDPVVFSKVRRRATVSIPSQRRPRGSGAEWRGLSAEGERGSLTPP